MKFTDLQKIASHSEIAAIETMQDTIHPDTCCNIQFTSGTTGKPKAAQLSHHNFVNNGFHIGIRNELDQKPRRICVQVPLFHAYGN
jgi:medium-chain acyl-CoA ligase, mitochondrial